MAGGGGGHSTMDSVLASQLAAPGSNPGVSENILGEKFVDVAKVKWKALLLWAVDSRGLIMLIKSI